GVREEDAPAAAEPLVKLDRALGGFLGEIGGGVAELDRHGVPPVVSQQFTRGLTTRGTEAQRGFMRVLALCLCASVVDASMAHQDFFFGVFLDLGSSSSSDLALGFGLDLGLSSAAGSSVAGSSALGLRAGFFSADLASAAASLLNSSAGRSVIWALE